MRADNRIQFKGISVSDPYRSESGRGHRFPVLFQQMAETGSAFEISTLSVLSLGGNLSVGIGETSTSHLDELRLENLDQSGEISADR